MAAESVSVVTSCWWPQPTHAEARRKLTSSNSASKSILRPLGGSCGLLRNLVEDYQHESPLADTVDHEVPNVEGR